ncbi:MAG: hypothetical protein V1736_00600 [Pseudomonadota bacterium]
MASRELPSHTFLGFTVFSLSVLLLLTRTEPVYSLFYIFAWWSYILVIDGFIYKLSGDSLLKSRKREFFLLIPWSVFIWLIFETFNFYIQNWYYVHVIDTTSIRWMGYFVAYGTVLPGLFETTELLETIGLYSRSHSLPVDETKHYEPYNRSCTESTRQGTGWYIPFLILGLASLILPIVWPRYFFPLVWGAFIFLLEPVNHYFGGRSLMRDRENGSLRKFYLLLTAGLVCGVLWELWNFWAGTKWKYSAPFFQRLKLFEMPVAGYLGFPVFAVECYVMYNFISLFRENKSWEKDSAVEGQKAGPLAFLLAAVLIISYCYLVFQTIDQRTVHSFSRGII